MAFDDLCLHKINLFVSAVACRPCDTWNADRRMKTYTLLQHTRSGVGSELFSSFMGFILVILVQKINVSSLKLVWHIIIWLCQLKEPSRKIEEDLWYFCEKRHYLKIWKGDLSDLILKWLMLALYFELFILQQQ